VYNALSIIAAVSLLSASALVVMAETGPAVSQARSNTGGVQPGETSDRTPVAHTPTPASQIDTTADGETSDRTPANHGEVRPRPVAVTN
jgi:hypothetical protein